MLAMAGALELQATSADRSVLDALDYVREFSVDGLRTCAAITRARTRQTSARKATKSSRGGGSLSAAGREAANSRPQWSYVGI